MITEPPPAPPSPPSSEVNISWAQEAETKFLKCQQTMLSRHSEGAASELGQVLFLNVESSLLVSPPPVLADVLASGSV